MDKTWRLIAAIVFALLPGLGCDSPAASGRTGGVARPNVILIVTDDQGYGDIGWSGNPVLKTPRLDRLAGEGLVMDRFYVSPVCAPTRACLLTGRYNYRTRVTDTYRGRALMDPAETTLAERLTHAGYRCGIFGKWHLGDNSPMRPNDQGFAESLVLRGGGIGQDSDPPGGSSYYDPILFRNGQPEKTKGYCSDVYTDAAIDFIEKSRDQPFFVYLPFNAPHVPLEINEGVEAYVEAVRAHREELGVADDPAAIETAARVYAMIANIDANVGRLVDRVDGLGLAESTLIVFLGDNGPQQHRWNAGLRGLKGSVYEGGVRVPFLARWPSRIEAGRRVASPGAHIDIVSTVIESCGVESESLLDGQSLWPLWNGVENKDSERLLFTQWHRGDVPERGRACAVIGERWKLVQAAGVTEGQPYMPKWELFDLIEDPGESRDVSSDEPEVVERLRNAYDGWFDSVSTQGFDPPRIAIGSVAEPKVVLTRQDWRGAGPGVEIGPAGGGWEIDVTRAGCYRINVVRDATPRPAEVVLDVAGHRLAGRIGASQSQTELELVTLPLGPARLDVRFIEAATEQQPERLAGARYVRIEGPVGEGANR